MLRNNRDLNNRRQTDKDLLWNLSVFTTRLAVLILFHAAGAGFALPSVLVTRPMSRVSMDWLPMDNQTLYRLTEGEYKNLELNTSVISQQAVYITISPCSRSFHWSLYNGPAGRSDAQLNLMREYGGSEMQTVSVMISKHDRYVLQLSSSIGGAVAVAVRGEAPRLVRMRLRTRSRRRLSANWDPSFIAAHRSSNNNGTATLHHRQISS